MKALTTYGSEQLTEEQAQDLVSQLEPDHNGVVNYVEYINMVRASMKNSYSLGFMHILLTASYALFCPK